MADGPPHARGIVSGRTATPALLVGVRIVVLALVVLGAGRRPVTDVQVLHAERIATSPTTTADSTTVKSSEHGHAGAHGHERG